MNGLEGLLHCLNLVETTENIPIEAVLHWNIDMNLMYPIPLEKPKKSNLESQQYKSEGDTYMELGLFENAVIEYTSALRMAVPNTKTNVSCYLSRAKALQKLKKFDDAAIDLDRASNLISSKSLRIDISETKKKLLNLTKKLKANNQQASQNRLADDDVKVSYNKNLEIPGASDAIRISYNKKYGRFFKATKRIAAASILLVQQPLFVFITEEKELKFCHYCIKASMTLIPCDSCTDVLYCSEECQKEAYEKYHEIECKLPISSKLTKALLRLFLIITKQGKNLKCILTYRTQQKDETDRRTLGFTNNQFNGMSAEALLSLLNHSDKFYTHDCVLITGEITALLQRNTTILKGHDVFEVGNLLFHLANTFRMNEVMIRDKHMADFKAEALYPAFNLLNHSCVSNTIWYTTKNNCRVLMASRDIEAGEQVFTNYFGIGILELDTEERQKWMTSIKKFVCHCEACKNNYTFKREIRRLKVPPCLRRHLRKKPYDVNGMWQVLKCLNQEIKGPSLDVELVKIAIMEAYMFQPNPNTLDMLRSLGII